MADKYTIQVNPQVSASDGQKMENELNARFANVARKFGTHLKNSLKTSLKVGAGAGVAGLVASLINPIEKINEDLKGILAEGDDIATQAQQFGISTENMTKLTALAGSAGADISQALQIFTSKLQEARDFQGGDTSKSSVLSAYIGKDIGRAFYEFLKTASNLPAIEKNAFIGKVFSDKMQTKLAELVQQDIDKRIKQVENKFGYKKTGRAIDVLAQREDQQAILAQRRKGEEFVKKSKVITKGTIQTEDEIARAKLNREVQMLSEFEIYVRQAVLQEKIFESLDKLRAHVIDAGFPMLEKLVQAMTFVVEKLTLVIDWLGKIVKAIQGKFSIFKGN
jgi:hypothetical protein